MKRIILLVLAAMALAGTSPSFAKTDCKKDVADFDLAVKTTKATKADVAAATKLRDEANKDCTEKGGSAKGDADMQQALKLIGAQ
jgi:hypothetical protein